MDASYNPYGGGGFQHHHHQRRSFDFNPNNFDQLLQQDISQQQALSPGHHESSGSSFTGSPAPAAPTHQQTTPQPYAAQLQQPGYRMPQSTTSPAAPQYSPETLSPSLNFGYEMSFGTMPTANTNGMVRIRNDSAAE